METSQQPHHPRHHSFSRPESLTDVVQDKTKISFISHSKNPQSSDNDPTPTTSEERSGEEIKILYLIISFLLIKSQ